MTINNFDAMFYTISFLVPGFVMYSAISVFQPQKELKEKMSFLSYLTLSSINYALWSWLIFVITRKEFIHNHPRIAAISWFSIVLVSPVIIGIGIGFIKQKEWIRKLLQKIGINTIHSIPTAWDYIFNKAESKWILVTLKDGNTVAGWFGSESLAASKADGKDIYIQSIYVIDDGTWEKPKRETGIWIDSEQIKHIEFIND